MMLLKANWLKAGNLRISVTAPSGDASLEFRVLSGGPNSEQVTLVYTSQGLEFILHNNRVFFLFLGYKTDFFLWACVGYQTAGR